MNGDSDERTVEDVMETRDRSLAVNYEPHDILQQFLERKLQAHGYEVEQYGLDDRHSDDLQFSGKPDLRVYVDEELVAYIEVKSKRASSDEWFGRLNRRHWDNYLYGNEEFTGAKELSVPVFIYFGVVEEDDNRIIRDGFIEVNGEDQVVEGFRSYGNTVIELDETDTRNYQWLNYRLRSDNDD